MRSFQKYWLNSSLNYSSESDNLARLHDSYDDENPAQLIEINDYYYHEFRDLFDRAGANPEDYLFIGD